MCLCFNRSEVRVLREAPVNEGVDIISLFKGGPNPSTINMLSGLLASGERKWSCSKETRDVCSFKAELS